MDRLNKHGRETERGNERVGKNIFAKRESERHSFSVHERVRGNETDTETERVRGSWNKGS